MLTNLNLLSISGSIIIFSFWGLFVFNENPIRFLITLELFLAGIFLRSLCYSALLDNLDGQIIALIILAVAASEAAIALAIIVLFARVVPQNFLKLSIINNLKG
jgi:NADH-quinone oxidoreductase subunit K